MPIGLIPALIGAGGLIGGSLLSRRSSNNSGTIQTDPQQQAIIDIQRRLADYGIPAGQESFKKAGAAYDTSLDFYKNILSGSNEDLMKLFNADEYTKSADESEATAYGLGARSGSRAAVTAGVGESRAANLNRVFSALRSNAPTEISNIGQAIANMGAQQISAGAGGLSGASNILFGLSQLKQQEADRRSQLIGSIIGASGTVLGGILGSR